MQLLDCLTRAPQDRPLVRFAVRPPLVSRSPAPADPSSELRAGPIRLPRQRSPHVRVVPHHVVLRHRALWGRGQAGRLCLVVRRRPALDGARGGVRAVALCVEGVPRGEEERVGAGGDPRLDGAAARCVLLPLSFCLLRLVLARACSDAGFALY